MHRPFITAVSIGAALLLVLTYFWVGVPPSNQELLANVSKAWDFAYGMAATKGLPWWSPNFLQGHSLAPACMHLGTNIWLLIWSLIGGIGVGPKIGGSICLLAGSCGTYGLTKRLLGSSWAAAVGALSFILLPTLYIRLGRVEHMVFVCAFAIIPLVYWSLVKLIETPSKWSGLVFGTTFSLLLLTYTKAAAIILPGVVVFGIYYWQARRQRLRIGFVPLLIGLSTIIVTGFIPLLPAAREIGMATGFDLGPLQGWREAFSFKSALVWLDRDGVLSTGMATGYTTATAVGGDYLGIIPCVLFIALLYFKPSGLYESAPGKLFRASLGMILFYAWLSGGPHSILGGHLNFLKMAGQASDYSIALAWSLLFLQPWVIYLLLPCKMPGRFWIAGTVGLIYLLVPGFRILEIIPIYAEFRAPLDLAQIGGGLFVAIATACGLMVAYQAAETRMSPKIAGTLGATMVAVAVWDVSPYFSPFFKGSMDGQTFTHFEEASAYLSQAPRNGSVYPVSRRYFYLLTPQLTKRALVTEAFNSYLMPKGAAWLQYASMRTTESLAAYLNLSGAAYVLVDKQDPETPKTMQDGLRLLFPAVFENEHFVVLENTTAYAPAALAPAFLTGAASSSTLARLALEAEQSGLILLPTIESINLEKRPGWAGRFDERGIFPSPDFVKPTGESTVRLRLSTPRKDNYHQIEVAPPGSTGLVIIPESWHPDWQAHDGTGEKLKTYAAGGAFLSVFAAHADQPILFTFKPPFTYDLAAATGALGWLGCFAALIVGASPVGFPKLRTWLRKEYSRAELPALEKGSKRPVDRALVIIPTYNESESLPITLEKAFASDPRVEVLIVDDNSPDGTAELVKEYPLFGSRLHLLQRPGKMGLGTAYKDAFKWAIQRNYDACIEMDADLSHDPADIPRLIAGLEAGYDAAIGSRYLNGIRVMNWPEHRLLLSTGASRYVRLCTGLPLTDATSGFKALRCSALKCLDWSKFKADGYGFQIELHYFLWQNGLTLTEVPIVFTERREGQTKMSIGIAVEAVTRVLQLGLTGNRHPLPASRPDQE